MEDKKFKEWYGWQKWLMEGYQDVRSRTAMIAGFFEANSSETFTGDQVGQMLALRYPEKE